MAQGSCRFSPDPSPSQRGGVWARDYNPAGGGQDSLSSHHVSLDVVHVIYPGHALLDYLTCMPAAVAV